MQRITRQHLLKCHFIFHYVCYYAAWVLGVLYAIAGDGWKAAGIVLLISSLQVIWQQKVEQRTQGLLLMVFIFTLVGFIVDSACLRAGIIFLYDNPWMPYWSPAWMMSLWMSFAVTYYAVMQRLWGRYWLTGFLAFFAVPLAYYAGIRLGVGLLPLGNLSLILYGAIWALLLPLCDYMCRVG